MPNHPCRLRMHRTAAPFVLQRLQPHAQAGRGGCSASAVESKLGSLERWAETVARDGRRSWLCACGEAPTSRSAAPNTSAAPDCAALRAWARGLTQGSGRRLRSLERWAERIARGGRRSWLCACGAELPDPVNCVHCAACARLRYWARQQPKLRRLAERERLAREAGDWTCNACGDFQGPAEHMRCTNCGCDVTTGEPDPATRHALRVAAKVEQLGTTAPPSSGTARTERRSSRRDPPVRAWPGSPSPPRATACGPRCGARATTKPRAFRADLNATTGHPRNRTIQRSGEQATAADQRCRRPDPNPSAPRWRTLRKTIAAHEDTTGSRGVWYWSKSNRQWRVARCQRDISCEDRAAFRKTDRALVAHASPQQTRDEPGQAARLAKPGCATRIQSIKNERG